jgi:hypothetical protein
VAGSKEEKEGEDGSLVGRPPVAELRPVEILQVRGFSSAGRPLYGLVESGEAINKPFTTGWERAAFPSHTEAPGGCRSEPFLFGMFRAVGAGACPVARLYFGLPSGE